MSNASCIEKSTFLYTTQTKLKIKTMNNKEILEIYKIAKKHWSRPAWLCWIFGWNYTYYGLCYYFQVQHTKYYCSPYFKELWYPCRTIQFNAYHFNTRKERLQAIRKVIKDLENEQ